ncbi:MULTISPECIES: hypothetical protein [Klebsiella]|uniref:hypothetical protein n=1 Tax=Klebsiella TaxID=570 RepID=UPI000D5792EE|nr:hypothetical protein [Klebsiella aerogenes]MDH8590179.1 hypothetical protein [Klebsiella pneumoniae]MDN2601433.1 hypothetical protein [Klebsiella pneumoniae]PVF84785.1 hypothetical protein CSC18_4901 [Klebsiella aerogenes]WIC39174.1 hypothetical protein QM153_25475 [Klebsiella pneumoniae]HBQ1810347.1 hypothetical protein [Klebsiella aerogenes]
MKRTRQEVVARWLASRAPEQRTGEEAQKFSDECWQRGLRLSAQPRSHYDLVMNEIRRTFIA